MSLLVSERGFGKPLNSSHLPNIVAYAVRFGASFQTITVVGGYNSRPDSHDAVC